MIVLYSVIVVLSILVITLVLRVVTTNIEIRNIIRDLEDITEKDTNILLTTSSGDKSIKSLVDSLNKELKKLLSIKREYSKGVFDVKKSAERSKRARWRTGILRAARLECSSRAIIIGNPQKMRISTKIIYFQDI